ncbi:MAG TPA: CHASE domain-containing protein [Lacunisphaera sp.]
MPFSSTPKPISRHSALLPWVVFVVTFGLTMAAWWLTGREVRRTTQARFERLTERVQGTLRRRFDTAALLLQGAAAFPLASDNVSAADWSVYLRTVSAQLGDGVVGLGYVEKIPRDGIDALEARMRADGETDFKVQRDGTDDMLYVVVAIEPRGHNTDVLGLDIASGVTRRQAAEMAAAEDALILSRRIRVNYDGRDVPGFLLFQPVYKKGPVPATRKERMAALKGWVYAPIRIDQLMDGVAESAVQQIDFKLFEGDGMRLGNLLYDSEGRLNGGPDRLITERDYPADLPRTVQAMDIYGQRWTLLLTARSEFSQAALNSLPAWVLGVGTVFSVLVTLLTWALVNARTRALILARDMTVDLRRLALVASHTGSGVIITDPEWRVEWINEGFTRMFGFTLDEIKGRKPGEFMVGPDSDPKAHQAMDDAGKMRRRFLGEILNYTKDGRKVWIELEIQPVINQDGEVEGFMGLQLDITARKRQAEQMREAMEAAEKANQAKSQFLAMMSHEIRTPMNGVIGMTSLLLDTPLNPDQRESAEIIRQSGESLLTIINDILDFSKIESGRLDLEQTEFAVSDCVEGALDLLAQPAAKKHLELLYEIADDLPAMVVGDAVRLRQVLVNLVGNAVKFTQKGEVIVTAKVVARQEQTVDLRFQVRDTGIGISADGMERLFKAFSQVDASMTRKFGGTGLGLAISRRLVELMGGRITAESELGRGSIFSFTLRLAVVADGAAVPPGAPESLSGRCVLIAESNDTARRIMVERVKTWRMQPVEVASASAVLEQLRGDGKFDVAVVDAEATGMDGKKLMAEIRELPGRAELPVILLSAQRQRDNTGCGASAVLTKPVKPTQLFDAFVEIFWPSRGAAATAPTKPVAPLPPPAEPVRVLFAQQIGADDVELREQFASLNCHVDFVGDRAAVIDAVKRRAHEVIFIDVAIETDGGTEIVQQIRHELPLASETWLVALTGDIRLEQKEAIRTAGIDDCLDRSFTQAQLAAALERAKWRLPG